MPLKPARLPMTLSRFGRFMLLAAAVLTAGAVHAEAPTPPPYYAITDVKVVSGSDAPLEGVTVLLADGLIEAVGVDMEIPADAWVIDGEGMTLFPGLVDAMTTLGQKQAEQPGSGGGGPPARGPVISGPEDRPMTTPWHAAADHLNEDGRVEKWRKAGFAAAVTSPEQGFFAGQAAWIHLGGSTDTAETVVATPVAQRINFTNPGRSRSFPGSLMGSLAYIQQVFADTSHYTAAENAYAADPLGRERPLYDRTLATLQRALADDTPFLLPAHMGREIDRALALASAQKLQAVIYGSQAAYSRVDDLKESGAAALISLNWPKEETDRDPDADTPFRTLYHRRMAPTTPAGLAAAGIPFAFYSDGLASPGEIFKNVRAAVEAGLSNEMALAAMTTAPAGIFGVDDRLGSIEAGKIANLVLASDWPWAEGVEVAAVFVDGHKYAERKSEETGPPPAADVSGTWDMTISSPRGDQDITVTLTMAEDGKVTGETKSERGTTPLEEGRMSGDLLRFKTTRSMGPRTFTSSWSLTVDGENLSGSASAGPMSMDISGERTATAEAKKDKDAADEETPAVSLAEMADVMSLMQNPAEKMDDYAITNATIWTLAGDTIDNGTVVVKDGRIDAVGADVKVPRGMTTIDAEGGHLIPGIIDAHSHIAIEGGVNEGSLAVTSMVAIGDVVNPDDIGIYRALAGGVTSANLLHGSANPIGGRNQVIKLRWGSNAEEMKFEGAPKGIKFALGENPKRSNFSSASVPRRYPQTRMGVMDVIREAFTEAQEYQKEWQDYEAALVRTGRRDKGTTPPTPPRRDRKLDALVEILEGERLVHSHCYRADEILQLLRLAEEFGFRVATLQHVLEGYKVADEIAAHGAGASTFSDWWGYKLEAYDAIPYNAALMSERGVLTSINSDSGEEMRHLNQEAAKAIKWGNMSEVEALKLVTLNPAIQLGISDRVGSIQVGKDADLVLYDQHPLTMQAVVQKTFVDGDLYFDLQADRRRQEAVESIKARLKPAEDKEDKEDGDPPPSSDEASKPSPTVIWQDETYSCRQER